MQQPVQQGLPKDGDLSPQGQWKWSEQSRDWIPNEQGKAGGGQDIDTVKQAIQIAMLQDLQTGGKNIAKLNTVLTAIDTIGGAGGKLTEGERAAKGAQDTATEALSILGKGGVKAGLIAGPLEQVKAIFDKGDPTTVDFNVLVGNLRGTITKARAGATLSKNEERLLNTYVPKIGDSRQLLETKLNRLMTPEGQQAYESLMTPEDER
jgi:hypothetical protein